MLETIIILVAGIWLFTKFAEKNKRTPSASARPAAAAVSAANSGQAAPVIRVLNIEGAAPYRGAVDFLRSFGLNPKEVRDVRFVAGPATLEAMSDRARGCLKQCYEEGNSRGPEVPGLLRRNEGLQEGQGVYFALIEKPGVGPRIVTFVDKLRASN